MTWEQNETKPRPSQEITRTEIYEFLSDYARELDLDEFSFFLIYMKRIEGGFEAIPYAVGKWSEIDWKLLLVKNCEGWKEWLEKSGNLRIKKALKG